MTAPISPNEKKRLKVLWQYEVLDTVPEEVFDDLTELAAQICEAPIALISLVDEKRQWFKSKVGITVSETSRDFSFCAHAINAGRVVYRAGCDPGQALCQQPAGDIRSRRSAFTPARRSLRPTVTPWGPSV